MDFFDKTRVWIAISLVFSLCVAFCAGASLLDVFVIEHDSNEEIIIENINFGTQNASMDFAQVPDEKASSDSNLNNK